MPIPFRETAPTSGNQLAAYLRLIEGDGGRDLYAGLFTVNASAEPVEFSYAKASVPESSLWRAGDARRRAVVEACKSLFEACSSTPDLILCRAEEVPPLIFGEDIESDVPLARVARRLSLPSAGSETEEPVSELHLYWTGSPPEPEAPARALLDSLSRKSLLLEPFDRAEKGIREVLSSI